MNQPMPSRLALCLAALACAIPPALAGQADQGPQIFYIYPAGAQRGTTLEVTVGGQNLAGTSEVYITGGGIEAAVLRHARPLSQQQLQAAEMKLREAGELMSRRQAALKEGSEGEANMLSLQAAEMMESFEVVAAKLGLDDPSPAGFAAFRRYISNPKRQPNAQLSDTVTLRLTLASNAQLGERQLRLKTPTGVTNPLYFQVGQYREYKEREPNDQTPDTGALAFKLDGIDLPDLEGLPVVLNGQIMPGDVDRFRLHIPKGTRLVVAVSARRLIPYLADAVPGWFQATLRVLDPKGREVAYSDDFRFDPDPVVYYEVPQSGDYTLEIADSIYRGREDFVYRIIVGEVPFITSIFPLGGPLGAKSTIEVKGWNLLAPELTLDPQAKEPTIIPVSVTARKRVSNSLPFALDALPECIEKEPNDDAASAQPLKLPAIVNGRVDRPGDWDVFRVEGRAGDEVVAEVRARRLESPLDSLLKLTDATGKILAVNDDHEDRTAAFTTHHADSFLLAKLPADGAYYIHVGDTQRKGGPAYAYRVRISPPQPDFDLRVAPCSLNARGGANTPMTVYARRKDGFTGDITLSLKDAPGGFALGGAWVPAGQDEVRLTLAAPPSAGGAPIALRLEGRARIGGKEVCRTAIPAHDMMQAFAYRHLVPAREWLVTVSGGSGGALRVQLPKELPAKLVAGATASVVFAVAKGTDPREVRLELSDPPKGIAIKELAPDPAGSLAMLVTVDAKEAKPGLKGNLILSAALETPVKAEAGQPQPPPRRTALGTLPALPFEVVAGPPATAAAAQPPAAK